jgi:hypothetical protein
MSECEFLTKCSFFSDQMAKKSIYSDTIKQNYCKTNPSSCARYLVGIKLGIDKVPSDLWPNNMETAKRLVADS